MRTTFSSRTTNSQKFRVLLKKRNNHKETIQPTQKQISEAFRQSHYRTKSQFQSCKQSQRLTPIQQMKSYVQQRIKTQQNDMSKNDQKLIKKSQTGLKKLSQIKLDSEVSIQQSINKKLSLKTQQDLNTINCLENKINQLVDLKLINFENNKDNPNAQQNSILDLNMEEIIKQFAEIKQTDNPEFINHDIQLISNKIKLIEKIMAENSTQSQLLKKYHLAKMTKLPQRSYSQTKLIENTRQSPSFRLTQYKPSNQFGLESMSHESFRKPERQAYKIFKQKNIGYNASKMKQPLPRSSYNRQFLVYGLTPSQEYLPKDNKHSFGNPLVSHLMSTSYRQNFNQKTIQRHNITDLDAYKDKYKLANIKFGQKQSQAKVDLNYDQYNKQLPCSNRKSFQQSNYLKNHLLSETRRQYINVNSFVNQTTSKHQYLESLKYSLKRKMHA